MYLRMGEKELDTNEEKRYTREGAGVERVRRILNHGLAYEWAKKCPEKGEKVWRDADVKWKEKEGRPSARAPSLKSLSG